MKKLACIVFFLLPLFLQAQQTNVDSLVNVLETKKLTTEEQLKLYSTISLSYLNTDLNKSIEYAKQALLLSEKENNKRGMSVFNEMIGVAYYHKSSFDSSSVFLNKSLKCALELNDKNLIREIYGNLGNMYRFKEDFPMAIDSYMKSLRINDTISKNTATNFINLAYAHRALQHWDRALEYLKQALTIAEQLNLDEQKMGTYDALSNVYSDKGDTDKSIEMAKKAFQISKMINNKQYQIITTLHIASSYTLKQKYEEALQYASDAMRIAEEFGAEKLVRATWITLSDIYRNLERYKDSETMALKAWAIDSTSLQEGSYTAFNLAIANIHLGDKQKAEYYVSKFQDIVFKGNDKQMNESLANMEVKYETQKKEIRIAALEKERKLYIILGIAVAAALLLGLGLLFYRHRLSIQKQKQLEKENELIAARSALDAEKAEREIIARDLHDGVGAILSVVKNNLNIMKSYSVIDNKEVDYFNKALDGLDKSIVELRRVAHHIMPAVLMEKGLFAALDDFCRSIPEAEFHYTEPERRFDPEKELVLYRCAYELVNNAMKHAKATKIEVHLNVDETKAYLSVVDNGCGFDLQNAPQGMGIKNLRTRLSAFGGSMDIFSEPEKGTEANVELKI